MPCSWASRAAIRRNVGHAKVGPGDDMKTSVGPLAHEQVLQICLLSEAIYFGTVSAIQSSTGGWKSESWVSQHGDWNLLLQSSSPDPKD